MQRFPEGKNTESDNSLFKRPTVTLLNEKQWSYLQKRYHLTARELQVSKLVCHGFSNEEIARELRIRQGTVKSHLRNVYRRVRVNNKISMLLKFVDAAAKFFAKPKIGPAIPIVDLEKPRKKTAAPTEMPKKKK